MPEPVIRGDSKVAIVCPDCGKTQILSSTSNPASAGGFIAGMAGALDDMRKNHKCPTDAPRLSLVD